MTKKQLKELIRKCINEVNDEKLMNVVDNPIILNTFEEIWEHCEKNSNPLEETISLNEVTKVTLPFHREDEMIETPAYLRDMKILDDPRNKRIKELVDAKLSTWKSDRPSNKRDKDNKPIEKPKENPIFEPKRAVKQNKKRLAIYGIEVKRREPPIHIIVSLSDHHPFKDETKTDGGKYFTFHRIFFDYNKYLHYLNREI